MKKTPAAKSTVSPKKATSAPKKAMPTAKKTVAAKKTAAVVKKAATTAKPSVAAGKKTVAVEKKSVATTKSSAAVKKPAATAKAPVVVAKKPVAVAKPSAAAGKKPVVDKKPLVPDKTAAVVEKHMNAAELESFKNKLLALRARLRGDVFTMADAALNKNRMESSGDLSTMPIHMADVGSDNFEQEQTLSFMESGNGILEMVDDALQRIKDGTYGQCEGCDCRIPKARLHAIPFAAKCVRCAASDELD